MKLITSIVCLLLSIFHVEAQNKKINTIDSLISYLETNQRGIGALKIWKNGQELYSRDFGHQQANLTVNEHSHYQIGSISKTYAAVLILQSIEEGKLKLEDKLSKFYPEIPRSEEITIEQMLAHTSGLGDFVSNTGKWLEKPVSEKEILSKIKKQKLVSEPGEKVNYSNSAYYLLACIVEKVHGENYGKVLRKKLLEPFGLNETSSALEQKDIALLPFIYKQDKGWVPQPDFDFTNVKGAGDIAASTTDLLKFNQLLFTGKIVNQDLLKFMKPATTKDRFGHGLMLMPFYDVYFYGHGGDTKGTHCLMAYNDNDSISIALNLNGQRTSRNDILIGILSILYDRAYDFPNYKTLKTDPLALKQYEGSYTNPNLPIAINVFSKKGVLYAQGTGQRAFPVKCTGEHQFEFEEGKIKMTFDPTKQTMAFVQAGKSFAMQRQ